MIRIENLSFGYTSTQRLFEQLNLTLPAGNIYGLLGKNGAGKSTLLKILAGVLFPVSGTLEVGGFVPKDRYPAFLREMYLITEECELPEMTLKQFVRLYSPFYPRFNHALLEDYLREFQLTGTPTLSDLSYGQKKKFLLSFGLATDCQLLVMDEPTNGLDVPSKSQFRKIVANAIHEDRTFLISTHQIRDMENLIDPIIILDEGQIVFCQSCEQVARKLAITRETEEPYPNQVIYYEPYLGGYTVVKENTTQKETLLSLELVFNAVISNKEKIHELFTHPYPCT